MACPTKRRRGKERLCIGDLRDRVRLRSRTLRVPPFGTAEPSELFGQEGGAEPGSTFASVSTVRGKTAFNAIGQERVLTHTIGVRWDPRITSEIWVELPDGRLLDVLRVTDLDERHEFMLLDCAERGDGALEANQA